LNAVVAVTIVISAVPANQAISQGELQRFTSIGRYPLGCNDATLAANGLRAKPTTDPALLHEAARVYRACATGDYGTGSSTLRNQANFNAAAALLLAARHEAATDALRDARASKALADVIAGYTHPRSVQTPALNDDPSIYRTDAGRIARDAAALLEAMNGPTST